MAFLSHWRAWPEFLAPTCALPNADGAHTLAAIDGHDASTPMMMYLPWQAVHAPYVDGPH